VKVFFEQQSAPVPSHRWHWAAEQLKALFDFTPRWCSAFYSTKGLAPWQAAATWINQSQGNVKPVYTIQLRPSSWVKWMVDSNEILAHEAVHAARSAFNEPKTEELFAYLTSKAKWRRVMGPLFFQPRESLILVGFIAMGSLLQIVEAIWDVVYLSDSCFLASAILALGWSVRLLAIRLKIKKAAQQLIPYLRDPSMVRAALFRMTDGEIFRLARGRGVDVKDELRWQLIRAAYLKESFGE
jgi:hypothetical protein